MSLLIRNLWVVVQGLLYLADGAVFVFAKLEHPDSVTILETRYKRAIVGTELDQHPAIKLHVTAH